MNAIKNEIVSSHKVEKAFERIDVLVDQAIEEKAANQQVRAIANQLVVARNTGKGWPAINALVTRLEEALKI